MEKFERGQYPEVDAKRLKKSMLKISEANQKKVQLIKKSDFTF